MTKINTIYGDYDRKSIKLTLKDKVVGGVDLSGKKPTGKTSKEDYGNLKTNKPKR